METNESTVKVQDMLPEALREAITPENLAVLQEEFDKLVECEVNSRLAVAIKSAEVSFDAANNSRIDKVVSKIDENNKIQLKRVYNKLNESHKKEMQQLKENAVNVIKKNKSYYEQKIASLKETYEVKAAKEAERFRKSIVENLNQFVTKQIDKLVPYNMIKEATRNNQAIQLLESFKQILGVDALCAHKQFKKPILEANRMINESVDKANKLTEEKECLTKELNEAKSTIADFERRAYLAERLSEVPSKQQREYVKRVLENAPIDFIKKNFEYTMSQYRTNVLKENATLAEKARNNAKSKKLAEHSRKTLSNMIAESKEITKPVAEVTKKNGGYAWLDEFVADIERHYD